MPQIIWENCVLFQKKIFYLLITRSTSINPAIKSITHAAYRIDTELK